MRDTSYNRIMGCIVFILCVLGIAFYLWALGISLWWLGGGLLVLAGLFIVVHLFDDEPNEPSAKYRITYDENGEPIDIEEIDDLDDDESSSNI